MTDYAQELLIYWDNLDYHMPMYEGKFDRLGEDVKLLNKWIKVLDGQKEDMLTVQHCAKFLESLNDRRK